MKVARNAEGHKQTKVSIVMKPPTDVEKKDETQIWEDVENVSDPVYVMRGDGKSIKSVKKQSMNT